MGQQLRVAEAEVGQTAAYVVVGLPGGDDADPSTSGVDNDGVEVVELDVALREAGPRANEGALRLAHSRAWLVCREGGPEWPAINLDGRHLEVEAVQVEVY